MARASTCSILVPATCFANPARKTHPIRISNGCPNAAHVQLQLLSPHHRFTANSSFAPACLIFPCLVLPLNAGNVLELLHIPCYQIKHFFVLSSGALQNRGKVISHQRDWITLLIGNPPLKNFPTRILNRRSKKKTVRNMSPIKLILRFQHKQ